MRELLGFRNNIAGRCATVLGAGSIGKPVVHTEYCLANFALCTVAERGNYAGELVSRDCVFARFAGQRMRGRVPRQFCWRDPGGADADYEFAGAWAWLLNFTQDQTRDWPGIVATPCFHATPTSLGLNWR